MKRWYTKTALVCTVAIIMVICSSCFGDKAEVTKDMEQDTNVGTEDSAMSVAGSIEPNETSVDSIDSVEGALTEVTLQVGTTGESAPFTYYDTDNTTLIGYNLDVLYALRDLLGFQIQNDTLRTMDSATLMEAVKGGDVDLALNTFYVNEDTKKGLDLSESYFDTSLTVVANMGKNKKEIMGADSFSKGDKAGVVKNTLSESYVKENISHVSIESFDTDAALYAALEQGKVDAIVQEKQSAAYYIRTTPGTKLAIVGEPFNLGKSSFAIAISKDLEKEYPGIVSLLNEAIAELSEKGVLQEIQQKWCP